MTLTKAMRGILFILPLTLAACSGGEPEAEAAPAPEPVSQPGADAMRNAFVDAFMRKDAAGAAVFYADDAVMYDSDGTVYTGKPAIEAAFTAMFQAGYDSIGLTPTGFETSGDLATDRGTFTMRQLDLFPARRGELLGRPKGGYMIVIGRQADGSFKVVKDSTWITDEGKP